MAGTQSTPSAPSTATIGFEAKLWLTADKLRHNRDAALAERSDHLPSNAMDLASIQPVDSSHEQK